MVNIIIYQPETSVLALMVNISIYWQEKSV